MKNTRMMLIACAIFVCMNGMYLSGTAQAARADETSFSDGGRILREPTTAPTSSWNGAPFPEEGSLLIANSATDSIPVDPATGKRPGILDWAGSGLDTSAHPTGSGHDPLNCNICR